MNIEQTELQVLLDEIHDDIEKEKELQTAQDDTKRAKDETEKAKAEEVRKKRWKPIPKQKNGKETRGSIATTFQAVSQAAIWE